MTRTYLLTVAALCFIAVLLLSSPLLAQSIGPRYPTVATGSTGSGTLTWVSPSSVYTANAFVTSVDTSDASATTKTLLVGGFGFSIPSNSRIVGVTVDVLRKGWTQYDAHATDSSVRLINGSGAIVGDNKATATTWPTNLAYEAHGGIADNWNAGLTAADVNSASFGVAIVASLTLSSGDPSGEYALAAIDTVRVTVYYGTGYRPPGRGVLRGKSQAQKGIGPAGAIGR